MNISQQTVILKSLSYADVKDCASRIAASGVAEYSPDVFLKLFGEAAVALADVGYANRLKPVLRDMGFAISRKMFPTNRRGFVVDSIKKSGSV